MQSQVFFYVDMQGKGKGPLPLHSIPKTNVNSKTKSNNKTKTKNKIKVVYTEDLTHPKNWKLLFLRGMQPILFLPRSESLLRRAKRTQKRRLKFRCFQDCLFAVWGLTNHV
jgi:hypothetical protein